jgi:acetyltransferase-like isoleucine patch superfamily enzyme
MPIVNCKISKNVKIFYPELVNLYNCKIGEGTQIGPFVEIQSGVVIGKNCKISSHSFICSGVKIGRGTFVGHSVTFINDKNPKAVNKNGKVIKKNEWFMQNTIIGSNVSIGSSVTIMCGIKIGDNCTVGAGTLVLKDLKKNNKIYNKVFNKLQNKK